MPNKAEIEILDVKPSEVDSELLWGFNIDAPTTGQKYNNNLIHLKGWAIGKKAPAVAVELLHQDVIFQVVDINKDRPDLIAVFPHVSEAGNAGFEEDIKMIGLPQKARLIIQAVLEDESRVLISEIQLTYQINLPPEIEKDLQRSRSHLAELSEQLERYKNNLQQIKTVL